MSNNKGMAWVVLFIILILMMCYGCVSTCVGSGSSSSNDIDYSEKALELGASTEQYTDAYNYWKNYNP